MEKQLFTWKAWDISDTMAFFFYDCRLKKDIGQFPTGSKIESVYLDYGRSVMEFYAKDGPTKDGVTPMKVIGTFDLSLVIQPRTT